MKNKLKTTAAILAGLFLLAILVQAESAELKERFLQRKPLLEQMKSQEWIGENNLGFLIFRSAAGQSQENMQIVQAENEDRKTVYAEIAAKVNTNVSVEEVGKRRAVQIAALAAVGHWLQAAEGNWYQKKQ
jgi:uncharacterized protein YdbL (DUF1318 family)